VYLSDPLGNDYLRYQKPRKPVGEYFNMDNLRAGAISISKRQWGTILVIAIPILVVIDLLISILFTFQINQREQIIPSQWTTYSYPIDISRDKTYFILSTMDSLGRIWIGMPEEKGLRMLNPDGSWTTYTTQNSGLLSNKVQGLASDNTGRIAVASNKGISIRASDGTWTTLTKELPPEFPAAQAQVFLLAFGKNGNIWMSGQQYVGVLSNNGKWSVYPAYQGYAGVSSVLVDESGHFWVGGNAPVINRLDAKGEGTILSMPEKGDEFRSDSIQDLAIDKQEQIWAATDFKGLFVIDPDDKWTSYTSLLKKPFLYLPYLTYKYGPFERVLRAETVAADGKGNIWFVSINYGPAHEKDYGVNGAKLLCKLTSDGKLISYSPESSGLPDANDWIKSLAVDNRDRLWIIHKTGITVFDDSSPFRPQTDLYTELIAFSAWAFWTKVAALALTIIWSLLFLYVRGGINRATIVMFIAGFCGWFILNITNNYIENIAVFLNSNFCPFYESGAPECFDIFAIGWFLFIVVLNIGIPIFLFKTKKQGSAAGFIIGFMANTVVYVVLGLFGGSRSFNYYPTFYYLLLPFFS
jgi:streptogramin lyase